MNFISTKRNKPVNLSCEDELLFAHEFEKQIPVPSIREVNNSFLLSSAACYQGGTLITESLPHKSLRKVYGWTHLAKQMLRFKYQLLVDRENYLLAFDDWSYGYFHWMTDTLQRIHYAQLHRSDFVLLLPQSYNLPYHIESLEILGIKKIKWLKKGSVTFLKNLSLADHLAPMGNYNPAIIRSLGSALKNAADEFNFGERIYISRMKSSRRKIRNESQVVEVLEQNGFQSLCFEDFTFRQQISIAFHARHLVSMHGAGLTNLLFMNADSNVLELRHENDSHNNCYFSLASDLDINYFYQNCRCLNPNLTAQDDDLVVDIGLLQENINLMTSAETKVPSPVTELLMESW